MKKFSSILSIVLMAVVSVSCEKKIDPTLEITPRSMECGKEGGTFTFQVACNTTWELEETDSTTEATFAPVSGEGDGVVSVYVAENTSAAVQQVKFKITAKGTDENEIEYGTLNQASAPFVGVDASELSLPANGGGRRVHVTANSAWSAIGTTVTKSGSNSSWCEATALDANGNIELNISAPANNTGKTRYAQFKLYLNDYPEVYCTVAVEQPSL